MRPSLPTRDLSLLLAAVLGASLTIHAAHAQPARYAEVRFPAPSEVEALAAAGVHLDHTHVAKAPDGARYLTTVLRADEVERLLALRPDAEVVVPDLAAAYRARPAPDPARLDALRRASGVDGFGYGSMGGYYTLEEVEAKLDEMRADYPALATEKVSIGRSVEGRDLWMVKLSANADADEDEPEALYTALHHAREPQSMATVLYFMFYLLERYGTDPEATYLLDHRELYFVPVLNPDGYVFNETTDPNGGGFWRKNRRDNGGGTFGVDLNRNYDMLWGLDNIGSSPSPIDDTYRGAAPFSEPETQAIRDFANAHAFGAALNYHSYSNLLIFPWGFDLAYTEDDARFRALAVDMTRDNGYTFGIGPEILYRTNGGSDDWMYGEQLTKPKILSFTPEVGSGEDGFWPAQDRIFPLAEENVRQNLVAAWAAGGYAGVRGAAWAEAVPQNGFVDPGERAAVSVGLATLGMAEASVRIRLVSDDPRVTVLDADGSEPVALPAGGEGTAAAGEVRIAADAVPGTAVELRAEVLFGDAVVEEAALPPFTVGTPEAFFADDASSLDAWAALGGWGLTTAAPYSPPTAFADSPAGAYSNFAMATLTLQQPVDLSDVSDPVLAFRARWDVEAHYDFAQVLASADGVSWAPLRGRYTRLGSGSGVQTVGQPGYDGSQQGWVQEELSLAAFAGEPAVHVRFQLRSDGSETGDGFDVDDVRIVRYIDGNPVAGEPLAAAVPFGFSEVFPNPVSDRLTVRYSLDRADDVTLDVVDVLGRRVRALVEGPRTAGAQVATWDGRGAGGPVPAGLYFVRLRAGDRAEVRRVTVLR